MFAQLFRLIEGPMKYFEKYLDILDEPEMKNIIKAYNTSAKTLVAYENVWISEWQDHATKVQKRKFSTPLQCLLEILHEDVLQCWEDLSWRTIMSTAESRECM